MNRTGMNKRLEALEVKHDQRRKGVELLERWPQNPRNWDAHISTLTFEEIEELIDQIDYLESISPRLTPDPELERYNPVDLKLLTVAELDAYEAEFTAFVIERWNRDQTAMD